MWDDARRCLHIKADRLLIKRNRLAVCDQLQLGVEVTAAGSRVRTRPFDGEGEVNPSVTLGRRCALVRRIDVRDLDGLECERLAAEDDADTHRIRAQERRFGHLLCRRCVDDLLGATGQRCQTGNSHTDEDRDTDGARHVARTLHAIPPQFGLTSWA